MPPSPAPLTDRIALVTGASRGIGAATALALGKAGARVVAVARTVGGLEELDDEIRKIGGSATLVPLDLKDYQGIARLAAALDALARTFAAETASTNIRVNLFNPGPTRTRMRAAVMPGEDPMTLPSADEVAEKIVALALPSFTGSGKLYDFRFGKLFSYRLPTDA